MSERYSKIFQLQEQEVITNSTIPLKIQAGALLLDTQQGIVIAQIKFKNISQKSIKKIKVNIKAFDSNGTQIQGVDGFEYENLVAAQGMTFGDKTPIPMTDNNAHSFSVDVINVTFSDNTTWSKFGEQTSKVISNVKDEVKNEVKNEAKTKPSHFIFNTLIFLLLLFITVGRMTYAILDISNIIFIIMTILAFPSLGSMLRKRENGKKLASVRWYIVIGLFILLIVMGKI